MLTTEIPEVNARKSAEDELAQFILNKLKATIRLVSNIIMEDVRKVVGKMENGMAMILCINLIAQLFGVCQENLPEKGIS